MSKTIFEEMGCVYQQQGDYFSPCLTLSDEKAKLSAFVESDI